MASRFSGFIVNALSKYDIASLFIPNLASDFALFTSARTCFGSISKTLLKHKIASLNT